VGETDSSKDFKIYKLPTLMEEHFVSKKIICLVEYGGVLMAFFTHLCFVLILLLKKII